LNPFRIAGFALSAGSAKTIFRRLYKKSPGFRRDIRNAFMLSREDFIFTIGYDGSAAVVDGQAKRRYGSLSTAELAEKGLFRAAYSSAVYSKKPEELQIVLDAYNKVSGASFTVGSPLDRLFGVFHVNVKRSMTL
jgi:DNA primase catalytic subunit